MRRPFHLLLVCILVWVQPHLGFARTNATITIASGTPVQLSAAAKFSVPSQGYLVKSVFIQMAVGGSGVGYVMDMNGYPSGITPSHSTSGNLTAQLAAATASAPGGSYSYLCANGIPCQDISKIWIDGGNTGDTVIVSWD